MVHFDARLKKLWNSTKFVKENKQTCNIPLARIHIWIFIKLVNRASMPYIILVLAKCNLSLKINIITFDKEHVDNAINIFRQCILGHQFGPPHKNYSGENDVMFCLKCWCTWLLNLNLNHNPHNTLHHNYNKEVKPKSGSL